MFCRKCGTQLPDDALFCSNCGEKTNVSAPIEPNAKAANTNVSSGNGNGNKNIIIGVIVAAVVACCAFFYVNYNSSFVPDFVSKDLKFTWNDDIDSISKKYKDYEFKRDYKAYKDGISYDVLPSISKIAGTDVRETAILFTKDNDRKFKKVFICFDLKIPDIPSEYNFYTRKRLPEEVIQKRYDDYRIQKALANERIKKNVDDIYSELANCYGNNPEASSEKSSFNIHDQWIWKKDDTIIKLTYDHYEGGGMHFLFLSFENAKYSNK